MKYYDSVHLVLKRKIFPADESLKSMRLKFWGVRGSLPVPSADKIGFGGNTACVEVQLPGASANDALLFDCGTGARAAGEWLQRSGASRYGRIHIFFSHFHLDHIQGLPFFAPLYDSKSHVHFYAHEPVDRLKQILGRQMKYPLFPIALGAVPAQLSFSRLRKSSVVVGEACISSFALNHPQGAWGYRVEAGNSSIVYACDHEHGDPACDISLQEAASNADVLIYDSQFTPSEYKSHRGWGHSTWAKGAALAKKANVKTLVLFHHSPDRTDAGLQAIEERARKTFAQTIAAREGCVLKM